MSVQQARRGKPTDLEALPKIKCRGEKCGRTIATGVIPPLGPGQVLVIQCWHRECKAFNIFRGD